VATAGRNNERYRMDPEICPRKWLFANERAAMAVTYDWIAHLFEVRALVRQARAARAERDIDAYCRLVDVFLTANAAATADFRYRLTEA
jgi:hypothetical protein